MSPYVCVIFKPVTTVVGGVCRLAETAPFLHRCIHLSFPAGRQPSCTRVSVICSVFLIAGNCFPLAVAGQFHDFILFDYSTDTMGMSSSRTENVDARIMDGDLGFAYRLNLRGKTDATLAYAWGKNSSDGQA